MPTRTHSSDPFAPRSTLSHEQLLAYAQGRLTPQEMHEVELHLEQDPLLREAAEGLKQPGAIPAIPGLRRPVPKAQGNLAWWLGGSAIVVAVAVYLIVGTGSTHENDAIAEHEQAPVATETIPELAPLAPAEIVKATEQPESLQIGHEAEARHVLPTEPVVVRDSIARVDPRGFIHENGNYRTDAPIDTIPRISRQLLFLHDLKLVHPEELYATDPVMSLADAHVAARFADRTEQDADRETIITMAYTDFMDEALGRFAEGDHHGCLDDLRFLLTQYPDDVNALFYAGLCSYDLGLFKRAERFLARAASHSIDVFDEEAAWYHALTLEKLGEHAKAQEEFARIAASGGFYAAKAKERTGPTSAVAQ